MNRIHEQLAALVRPIGDANIDPANVRTHSERNIDAIARSLARWGQRQPIIVQREGMVVRAGNGRILAARSLGWEEMAMLVVDEDSVEAAAFAIADNRTSELAEWDDEALVAVLESLPDDITVDVGFDDAEIAAIIEELTPPTTGDWADHFDSTNTAPDEREQITFVLAPSDMERLRAHLRQLAPDKNKAILAWLNS